MRNRMPALEPTNARRAGMAVLARLLVGVPAEADAALDAVGAHPGRTSRLTDGSFVTEFDLPVGRWRLWPELGFAIWSMPSRNEQVPPSRLLRRATDLNAGLRRLCGAGMWPNYLALRHDHEWSIAMDPADALRKMSEDGDVDAVAGAFEDGATELLYAEIFADGSVLAPSSYDAERVLARVIGLDT